MPGIENAEIEVYKDDIDMYIHLWMEERNIEDLCKISQNRWYNCCKYIYEHVFKVNPKYLKDDNNINNAYDTDKVNEVLDIYIDLCNDYEKIVNIIGLDCCFSGAYPTSERKPCDFPKNNQAKIL